MIGIAMALVKERLVRKFDLAIGMQSLRLCAEINLKKVASCP